MYDVNLKQGKAFNEVSKSSKLTILQLFRILRLQKEGAYVHLKRWTCELYVNNKTLIETKKYKASFQRIRQDHEIVKTIDTNHIIGRSEMSANPTGVFSIHIKVQIFYGEIGTTSDVTVGISKPRLMIQPSCWFGAAKELIDSGDMADFTFIIQGKEFKVHKLILSLTSSVFRDMFQSRSDETMENCAKLHDCDFEMFQHLLDFIYKGIMPVNIQEIALDLYKLARTYQIESL